MTGLESLWSVKPHAYSSSTLDISTNFMYKDPIKQRKFQRDWQRKLRLQNKLKVVKMLGGQCQSCGYSLNYKALQIDHLSVQHRKRSDRNQAGSVLYRKIANGKQNLEEIQLICANCHAIKTYSDRTQFKNFIHD